VNRPPAVVLGGAANAVSLARSLGAAGVKVYALGTGGLDPVRHSRFATYVPFGGADPVADWLGWLDRGPTGAVLLPCNDDGVELVARNRARLVERGYRPVETNDEVALAMLDKARTYELARANGIATPATMSVADVSQLDAAASEIGFPCALKPASSHRFARHFTAKAFVVHDPVELAQAFAAVRAKGLDVFLTEIIPGDDDRLCSYYSFLDENGEPLFHFTKRKLRQYPPSFGLASYEASAWDPELAEAGFRFFREIGLRGLATVEFKRDPRDGELKLIECNYRFTASAELVRIAGLDLGRFVYGRLAGTEPGRRPERFRDGVRLWHPVDDFRAMVALRRTGRISAWQWARSIARRQHFPLFRLTDPLPTVATNVRRARRLLARSRAEPELSPSNDDAPAAVAAGEASRTAMPD
jgi:predicted ATP-grasp superfamily ATP-dependent carboligase